MSRVLFYISSCLLVGVMFLNHEEPRVPLFELKEEGVYSEIPVFIKNDFPLIENAPSVHSSSLTQLADGRLMAVWFAGSGEGMADAEIYASFYDARSNLWSKPTSLLDRKRLSQDSKHFIKKLGNPVLYRSENGDLHLFVVGVSMGGWATSRIYHYAAKDLSEGFAYVGLLHLGAVMNLSHLVRSSPVSLEDGGFYLPIYHELASRYPLIVRFDREGNMLYAQKIGYHRGQLQPSIVALSEKECLAAMRNYDDQAMNMQFCKAGGLTWEDPIASNIVNENNSVALFKLGSEIFLIHNTREKSPQESRGTLVLSRLVKGNWEQITILDVAQGERGEGKSVEVSYPNVQTNGDQADVVYTNNRTHISHIRFNLKWIKEKIQEGNK